MGSLALSVLVIAAGPAAAQTYPTVAQQTTPSMFARDRNIAVEDRVFPGFQPLGLPVGVFRLYPSLGLTTAFTSNVFDNNERQKSDGYAVVTPQLDLNFDTSQLILDLYAKGEVDRFADYDSENEDQGTAGFSIRRNLPGYSYVFADGAYGYLALPRMSPESPVNAAEPLRYAQTQADFGAAYEQNRVRLTGRFDLLQYAFDNGEVIGGGLLSTLDHDRTRFSATARAEYALSPQTSIYVGGSGNTIDYRLDGYLGGVRRDSHGYQGFVGSSLDLTNLVRADVQVGYLDQIFDQRNLGGVTGLGVRGKLEYFPSRLTTVTLTARRSVEDSGIPNTGGYTETGGSASVDHELRRYIMLNAKFSYYDDTYVGIDRHDETAFASLGGTYLSAHHWNAKLAYEFYHQNSNGSDSGVNYDDHRVIATLTLQY